MAPGARLRPPRNRRFSTFNHQVGHHLGAADCVHAVRRARRRRRAGSGCSAPHTHRPHRPTPPPPLARLRLRLRLHDLHLHLHLHHHRTSLRGRGAPRGPRPRWRRARSASPSSPRCRRRVSSRCAPFLIPTMPRHLSPPCAEPATRPRKHPPPTSARALTLVPQRTSSQTPAATAALPCPLTRSSSPLRRAPFHQTHATWGALPMAGGTERAPPRGVRVLVALRDPRDVCVSLYFHSRALQPV